MDGALDQYELVDISVHEKLVGAELQARWVNQELPTNLRSFRQTYRLPKALAEQLLNCCFSPRECKNLRLILTAVFWGARSASEQFWFRNVLHDSDDASVLEVHLRRKLNPYWLPAEELQEQAERHPSAKRVVSLASAIAVEPESGDEWHAHLYELAATSTRTDVIRFMAGILYASLHSRACWLARQAATPGVSVLCWALRSDARTWTVLAGLLLWAGVETAADTGVGAAILVVLLAFSGLVWVVERLRNRYDAHPPEKSTPPQREE